MAVEPSTKVPTDCLTYLLTYMWNALHYTV